MSGALQITFQNMRSFTATPAEPLPTIIGQAYGGGFYAGQISTTGNSVADYYLVTGPISTAESNKQWKTSNSAGDPTSVIDGPTNSTTMNSGTYPAAQFCKAVTAGGFNDWYMPAINELQVLYFNLKPTTTSNNTSYGLNPNAVPARTTYYTAGNPAQTTAADFITSTGAQAFTNVAYWSSTEASTYQGFSEKFNNGQVYGYASKTTTSKVRAVRRVAVATPTVIGQVFGGGYYAGVISTAGNSVADYYLITGPVASAQGTYQCKSSNTATSGATSLINGPANSAAMNDGSSTAAQFCEGLTVGVFSDWYMPAINELEICYYNLKPTTQSNNTSYGINANAVPARASNYTAGNPAQTSAAAFVTSTGAEAYTAVNYWSSTESTASATLGKKIFFPYGGQYNNNKTASYLTRAVRRVVVPPTLIGQAFGGGYYSGQISTAGNGIPDYYLVTGPISSAQSVLQYKTTNTTTPGTTSVIDGPANSATMNDGSSPAAQFCEALTVGGFTDWYLPALNELEVIYYYLRPTTNNNNTGYGINPNAVPARTSNYTAGTPPQTSAADFKQTTGAEALQDADYWCSTEYSATRGGTVYFYTGVQRSFTKTTSSRLRAVRRVAV